MELKKGTGVALWSQIMRILLDEIRDGVYCPGDKLPTEAALSGRFGVNRHTVRRALGDLEERGVIRVEQGRGSFVREDVVSYDISRRVRFSENLSKLRKTPGGEVLDSRVVPAEGLVAKRLRLVPGAPVVRIETVSRADGTGLLVCTHYFPADRFPGIDGFYREKGSVTACLALYGVHDYVRSQTRITTRLPSGTDAALLDQPRTKPVLVVESVNADSEGRPVEYGLTRWAGDRVEFVVKA